jgi:hypothetical protein
VPRLACELAASNGSRRKGGSAEPLFIAQPVWRVTRSLLAMRRFSEGLSRRRIYSAPILLPEAALTDILHSIPRINSCL